VIETINQLESERAKFDGRLVFTEPEAAALLGVKPHVPNTITVLVSPPATAGICADDSLRRDLPNAMVSSAKFATMRSLPV
jgi:hypothetical protein